MLIMVSQLLDLQFVCYQ